MAAPGDEGGGGERRGHARARVSVQRERARTSHTSALSLSLSVPRLPARAMKKRAAALRALKAATDSIGGREEKNEEKREREKWGTPLTPAHAPLALQHGRSLARGLGGKATPRSAGGTAGAWVRAGAGARARRPGARPRPRKAAPGVARVSGVSRAGGVCERGERSLSPARAPLPQSPGPGASSRLANSISPYPSLTPSPSPLMPRPRSAAAAAPTPALSPSPTHADSLAGPPCPTLGWAASAELLAYGEGGEVERH